MTKRLMLSPFSLHDTLECGQFFRFTKVENTYLIQASGRIFSLWQKRNVLFYEGVEESFLIHFFRLEEDLDRILAEIDCDPSIHQAIQQFRGMRLIRQDPWECLHSFLCSSAKAIPHIRTMVELLCRSSGKKTIQGGYVGYGFPEPQSIKNGFQLASIKAGFRTDYLVNANQCMDRNRLLDLKTLPFQEAKERLMSLSGVGKKVADCVLLYSLDFLEAFPIDTWIKRGLQRTYFNGDKVGEGKMEHFIRNHFGPYAGYAQLYLYHFWRNNGLL